MVTELVSITLENEMDLTLAYKRSILTAGMLGLTVATQTAFATAVSEVCREVIDKAIQGLAKIGTTMDAGRFFLTTFISAQTDEQFDPRAEGFEYARKLVPVLEINRQQGIVEINLKLAIPRANRLDQRKINQIKRQIEQEGPVSAYEEVKQRNAELGGALSEATQLNQQKNEFLSVASHELNSPLTVMRSYAQLALKTEGGANPVLHEMLKKIELQSDKLIRLVRQLMDISKLEHGEITYDMQPLSSNAFLSELIERLQLLVATHAVDLFLAEDRLLMADALRLEQVLSNLVGNAAKYSSAGSRIRISTQIADHTLLIAVTDEGIGMSPEVQQQVFEKFYREKKIEKKYSGLGMGLYIASRIVNDHAGSITVSSIEGQGSTFSVVLPLQ